MSEWDDYEDENDNPTPEEVAAALRSISEGRARRQRELKVAPSIEKYFVHWDAAISAELVEEFRSRLDSATTEQDMQAFLASHPTLLVQPLGGGHGRWVIPQKRLGAEHVPDFMIAEKSPIGFEWTAVELESPKAKMFTKAGELSATTNHAIRQIEDWRVWLGRNRDYATRPHSASGLGLVDVDANVPGWVIIGRREEVSPDTHGRRRERGHRMGLRIHSYDWLLERAAARVRAPLAARGASAKTGRARCRSGSAGHLPRAVMIASATFFGASL